ncbi:MAG: DUF2007 domain-containing protein [Bryobacteraceae bacterium]|jgi:hypothetical protein
MYCPECLTEYRDGFFECADCRVPLAAGLPPKLPEQHDLELVTVLETHDGFALSLAKASLEEAGIEYLLSGDDPRYIAGFPGAFGVGETPLCSCSVRIQVASESEAEARVLLEPLRNPDPAPGLEAESEPGS